MTAVSAIIVTRGDVDMQPILDSLPDEWEKVVYVTHGGYDVPRGTCHVIPAGVQFVWNPNECGSLADLSVYGRYAAIEYASGDLIYVQDDDVIVSDPGAFVAKDLRDSNGLLPMDAGYVVCNQPPEFRHDFYVDHALVGFGACFHRDLPTSAFGRYLDSRHNGGLLDIGGIVVSKSFPTPLPQHEIDLFYRTCDIVFTALTPRVLVDVPVTSLPYASDPGRMWTTPGHQEERSRMLALALAVKGKR